MERLVWEPLFIQDHLRPQNLHGTSRQELNLLPAVQLVSKSEPNYWEVLRLQEQHFIHRGSDIHLTRIPLMQPSCSLDLQGVWYLILVATKSCQLVFFA